MSAFAVAASAQRGSGFVALVLLLIPAMGIYAYRRRHVTRSRRRYALSEKDPLIGPFIASASRRHPAGRGYGSFLRAIRSQGGFQLRIASLAAFAASLAATKGAITAGITLGATLVGCGTLGYLLWRAWGP